MNFWVGNLFLFTKLTSIFKPTKTAARKFIVVFYVPFKAPPQTAPNRGFWGTGDPQKTEKNHGFLPGEIVVVRCFSLALGLTIPVWSRFRKMKTPKPGWSPLGEICCDRQVAGLFGSTAVTCRYPTCIQKIS